MITYSTTEQDGITYILQEGLGEWRIIKIGDDWFDVPEWKRLPAWADAKELFDFILTSKEL